MNLEFVGTPILQTSGGTSAEKVKLLITRDDGTSVIAEARAIQMRVAGLTIEAWMVTAEGKISLALTTFETLSVSPGGDVGKVYNTAVQTEEGDLTALQDQPVCVTLVVCQTTDEIAAFIVREFQQSGIQPVPATTGA